MLVKDSPEHDEYMHSVAWRERRIQTLTHADFRCQLCNRDDDSLQAHHRTYERLGCEDPSDLIALCRICHSGFHRWERRRRYWERTEPEAGDDVILAHLEQVTLLPSAALDPEGNQVWRGYIDLEGERPISAMSTQELRQKRSYTH